AVEPGPVLTRQPGEVFWLTGRQALAPPSSVEAIEDAIDRYGVAYLIVDEGRYANAPENPLERFVRERPKQAHPVWGESRTVRRFCTRRLAFNEQGPRSGASRSPRSDGSSAGSKGPS